MTAIIVKDDKTEVINFTGQLRKRRNITREMTAKANPGIHPIKRRHRAMVLMLQTSMPSSPKGNPDSKKVRMNSTKEEAEVAKEAKAKRKGKAL